MSKTSYVSHVFEENLCDGRKRICIADEECAGMFLPRFAMTPQYMLPEHKLFLSTVTVGDSVSTIPKYQYDPEVSLLEGYFTNILTNISDLSFRPKICKCGTLTVSDGFAVSCPNNVCGLTLNARIRRLIHTAFFPNAGALEEGDGDFFSSFGYNVVSNPYIVLEYLENHITEITYPDDGYHNVFVNNQTPNVSMATFLVKDLFMDFLECLHGSEKIPHHLMEPVFILFGHLEEIINRRDYNSRVQNRIIAHFIWALGIESLDRQAIDAMINYEIKHSHVSDVFVKYFYLLTNPSEMVRELNLTPVHASRIFGEVNSRRDEFFDLILHYVSPEDASRLLGFHLPKNKHKKIRWARRGKWV